MSKLSTAIKLIKDNKGVFCEALLENIGFLFPDKLYLQLIFRCKMGYWMDFDNPKTFNEKLQWLKLYNRNPFYTTLVDKYAVKEYVANLIGKEYVIPTLGVWNNAKEIDFDKLPNQFVLKTTNGGGGDVVICKDKSKLDREYVVKHLNQSLKKSIYKNLREWPYKNVLPRVIAEKYMEDEEKGELRDYKFYTFNGEPKFMLLVSNRFRGESKSFDYFDMSFNHVDLKEIGVANSPGSDWNKPQNFEKMKQICRSLAKNLPMVRVDLYDVNGSIYFGELTFFDAGGFMRATPQTWEKEWGDLLNLPVRRKNDF